MKKGFSKAVALLMMICMCMGLFGVNTLAVNAASSKGTGKVSSVNASQSGSKVTVKIKGGASGIPTGATNIVYHYTARLTKNGVTTTRSTTSSGTSASITFTSYTLTSGTTIKGTCYATYKYKGVSYQTSTGSLAG